MSSLRSNTRVSILVLVDVALEPVFLPGSGLPEEVSILVLVDVALERSVGGRKGLS